MIVRSCFNLSNCNNENFDSVKSCFSCDDCFVLKKHPEMDITFNNILKSSIEFTSNNLEDIYDLFYEYESYRQLHLQDKCDPINRTADIRKTPNELTKLNTEKHLNSNVKKEANFQKNKYEYLSPYQKKLKDQKTLQTKLFDIENEIHEKKMELKNIEDLFQTDINILHLKKLRGIDRVNEKVNSVTDKIIEVKNKKLIVNQTIKELNKRIKEIEEMTKVKEMKMRECYLKIHQKGRQAFQFNKKLEVLSSINLDINSDSCLQLKNLEDILKDLKQQIDEIKKVKLHENYSHFPCKLNHDSNSYLVKITRDCLFYYLTSKSKEEKTITLRAMVNILPFHSTIKEKLLGKINK